MNRVSDVPEHLASNVLDMPRIDEATHPNETNLEAFFERSDDLFFVLDRRGYVLRVNEAALVRLEYSRDEMNTKHVEDLLPPQRREEAATVLKRMLAGQQSHHRIPLITRRGDELLVEAKVVRGEWSGEPALFGVCRDVTDREKVENELRADRQNLERLVRERTAELERANEHLRREIAERAGVEAALRLREAQLRAAVENLPFEIFLIDESGRYVMYNSRFERHWGDAAERRPRDIAPDTGTLAVWKEMNARAFTGEVVDKQITRQTGSGEEHIHGIVAPVWDDGRVKAILGVGVDISDRVRAEEEAKLLESRLREAHKLEAVGTLAGGIAHAFNNILMAILGHVSLMLDDLPTNYPYQDDLESIEQQVRHAAELTSQLLGYARKGKYEVRTLDLNGLVEAMSETFASAHRELVVEHHLAAAQLPVDADQGQIEQVLLNLCVNAADAMPNGGCLTLRTSSVSHAELPPQAEEVPPGQYAAVSVCDDGIGIPSDDRGRIFDPFFTTKALGRDTGLGLGLASVYGIVKGHGGYVDVESEVGRGTTFTVYLRVSDSVPLGTQDDLANLGRGAVLVVDDEAVVLEVGARMIKRLGFAVQTATSGEEALQLFEAHSEGFDLVVLDMVMPGMGGGEVFDRLRAIDPEVRVVLSSGFSINDRAREILDRGCDGFIQKPFNLNELSRRLQELLRGTGSER